MNPFHLFDTELRGLNLVESSAGTGKTYSITGLYIRFIAERGLRPSEILVVTFTKAATQELRERIAARLKESVDVLENEDVPDDHFLRQLHERFYDKPKALEYLKQAWNEADMAAIYTIHGFCQQALQEFIFESNSHFDVEYTGNDKELITKSIDAVWRNELQRINEEPWRKPLVDYLIEGKKSPDELLKIVKSVKGKPYLKFTVSPVAMQIKNLCELVIKSWEAIKYYFDEGDIKATLLSGELNGQSYNEKSVDKMMDEARKMIQANIFPIDNKSLKSLEKLSAGFIEGKVKKNCTAPEHPLFDAVQKLFELDLKRLEEMYLSELAEQFSLQYEAIKSHNRIRTFDDILLGMKEATQDARMVAAIQKAYPVALVDEFQDTDPIQLEIFEHIYTNFENGCLFLIGDPKQSIYRFRGADIFSYLHVQNRTDVQKYTLGKNYRSSSTMVSATNTLFEMDDTATWPGEISFFKSDAHKGNDEFIIPENEPSAPLQFLLSSLENGVNKQTGIDCASEDTANEIARLLQMAQHGMFKIKDGQSGERNLKAGDVAVLVQRHQEADKVIKALQKKGIKSVSKSRQSVFSTEECSFLIDLISVIRNPGYASVLRMFLFSAFIGNPLSKLKQLEEDSANFALVLEYFLQLKDTFESKGFVPMIRTFLHLPIAFADNQVCDVETRLLSMDMAERRYTNLIHLSELIGQFEREHKPGLDELLKWLMRMREETDLEETEIRLDSDDELVQIITIHSSKGLQFPVVFCPMLWNYGPIRKPKQPFVFHHPQKGSMVDFCGLNEETAQHFVKTEEMAEHIRLAYVAVTRARYRCYLSIIPYKGSRISTDESVGPLTFLLADKESKALIKKMNHKDFDEKYLQKRALKLSETYPDLFHAKTTSTFNGRLQIENEQAKFHPAKKYIRTDTNRASWFITSYSGLKKKSIETEDNTEPEWSKIDHSVVKIQPPSGQYSMQNFPKGAKSGIFLHKLFEDISFQDFEENVAEMVENYLKEDGYDSGFKESVIEMMRNVLSVPLPQSEARLSALSDSVCQKELEFYFSLNQADSNEIARLIEGQISISGVRQTGFMSGFIDLLFEFNGAWYILDYKSDTVDDYSMAGLKSVMLERGYIYQYHIYLVALVRFLKEYLKEEFDYNKHIGGAYYLFLRGIKSGEDSNGIFFDKPSESVINALDSYFGGHS